MHMILTYSESENQWLLEKVPFQSPFWGSAYHISANCSTEQLPSSLSHGNLLFIPKTFGRGMASIRTSLGSRLADCAHE